MLHGQNHPFIWRISHSHSQLIHRRQLRNCQQKVQQIKTIQGRLQEVSTLLEIFEASLGGMVVNKKAAPPILSPRLVMQTLPTLLPFRTTVETFVTDVEN